MATDGQRKCLKMLKPFLKWAGGKRAILPQILKHIPKEYNTYYEPMIGAGALFFELMPKAAVINDVNEELINCYEVIRNNPQELIEALKNYKNSEEFFYKTRALDRSPSWGNMSRIDRAARTIYLNKTCYNGLYRVNSRGQFNAPYGRYSGEIKIEKDLLINISNYFKQTQIEILNKDFKEAISLAKKGDFIYFDPPYDPLNKTSSFTAYTKKGFDDSDQIRLKDTFVSLVERGCSVLLSNSSTDFIRNLYKDYQIVEIMSPRCINSEGQKRGKIKELLIIGGK